MEPSTLNAERENRELNRPVVFDPALRQFIAHRAGEPRFEREEDAAQWYECRMAVLFHILNSINNSDWSRHLVLRGSAVMMSWFGNRARRPGDLDWIVIPQNWDVANIRSKQMIGSVMELLDGSTVRTGLVIPSNKFAMEEIWTYEKAPGLRIVVPWEFLRSRFNGTVQMDFVFGELMPSPPVVTPVTLGGSTSITLQTASREQSLAWKILWLATDSYAMGKDLYDAVILAEGTRLEMSLLKRSFDTPEHRWYHRLDHFNRDAVLGWRIEWDDFLREYPDIGGSAHDWQIRLANALEPIFQELSDPEAWSRATP